jgi:hypothetical protein
MSVYLWRVVAVKDTAKLAKGMSVEIVIRNASRKPNQKEVLEAFNQRFGAGTAPNGTSLTNFQIEKV